MGPFQLLRLSSGQVEGDGVARGSCNQPSLFGRTHPALPPHSICHGSRCRALDPVRVPRSDSERGVEDVGRAGNGLILCDVV